MKDISSAYLSFFHPKLDISKYFLSYIKITFDMLNQGHYSHFTHDKTEPTKVK